MAMYMSNGTKGIKSRWVTIVIDREELDKILVNTTTARSVLESVGGRIYGE